MVWGISQQAGIAGRTSVPLLTHPSSHSLRSPSGAVPMVGASPSALSGIWSTDIKIITRQVRLQMQTCQVCPTSRLITLAQETLQLSCCNMRWCQNILLLTGIILEIMRCSKNAQFRSRTWRSLSFQAHARIFRNVLIEEFVPIFRPNWIELKPKYKTAVVSVEDDEIEFAVVSTEYHIIWENVQYASRNQSFKSECSE